MSKVQTKYICVVALSLLLVSHLHGVSDCDDKVFSNLSSSRGTTIAQLLEQLSSRCSFSISIKDSAAEDIVANKGLNTINLRDFTLFDVFDFLLTENGLDYEYQNGILRISSYSTKTFKVDYITAVRTAESTLSVGNSNGTTSSTSTGQEGIPTNASVSNGSVLKAMDSEMRFWENIRNDLQSILSSHDSGGRSSRMISEARIQDTNQGTPTIMEALGDTQANQTTHSLARNSTLIINPQAGLVTVTANKAKLKEVEEYINTVIDRLHRQVLIDVQILEVTLSNGQTTGIDWNQIYNLQNINAEYGLNLGKDYSRDKIIKEENEDRDIFVRTGTILLGGSIQIKDIIKFLKTQGSVRSISNPKLLTLNNQPALINSGDVIFYPKVSGGTAATATTGATNPTVESIPINVGVALDITPEIIDENTLLLKINPTSSSCKLNGCPLQRVKVGSTEYDIAPSITQKQISSVIKAADGDRIILGGLIQEVSNDNTTKVPGAGDIPLLGYLFKQDVDSKELRELVIIITPHIVKKEKPISLKDLGYKSDF